VVTPLVVVFAELDESERHGGRNLTRLRPMRSYTTLRDVTPVAKTRGVMSDDASFGATSAPHAMGLGAHPSRIAITVDAA